MKNDTTPATKADIIAVKDDIVAVKADITVMKDDIIAVKADIIAMKADINELKQKVQFLMDAVGNLYDANEKWKDEIIRHFDVVLEDLRHDLLGVNRDEIELLHDAKGSHDQRITRLEKHVGIVV